MSSHVRPAGIEAFAKCPAEGCGVHVYGPIYSDNYCRDHGGNAMFEQNVDEYGNPRTADAAEPSPAASRP